MQHITEMVLHNNNNKMNQYLVSIIIQFENFVGTHFPKKFWPLLQHLMQYPFIDTNYETMK